jgi:glycosyltransferase involved in cell wall biosynthesis
VAVYPEVTVLLPVYNGARYLHRAITSVLAQDLEAFELVISDDNSTDHSAAIVESFRDPRIVFERSDRNLGIFGNLNRAARLANAEYLQIFAQDDVLFPQCLSEQRAALEAVTHAGMAFCQFSPIDENEQPIGDPFDPKTGLGAAYDADVLSATPLVLTPDIALRCFAAFGSFPGNISDVMLRRSAYRTIGPFNPDLRYSGDFDYWVRLARRHSIVWNRQILLKVRRHAEQATYVENRTLDQLRQEIPIWRALFESFPEEERADVEWYVTRMRGVQYLHGLLRACLRGDISTVHRGLGHLQPPFTPAHLIMAAFSTRYLRRRPDWTSILAADRRDIDSA